MAEEEAGSRSEVKIQREFKRQQILARFANAEKQLKQSVDEVLRTESGRRVFAHLHRFCGFAQSCLVVDRSTGGIDTVTTALNDARRGVYLHLRELASRELLIVAEELAEAADVSAAKTQEEARN